MSRPLAWNGTGWVDPAFHVGGGVYKSYIAPVYDQPIDNEFTSGVEGWEKWEGPPDWLPSGQIAVRVQNQPWAHYTEGAWGVLPDQNRKIGFSVSYRLLHFSGTTEHLDYTFGNFGFGGHEEGFRTGPVGRDWSVYTTQAFANLPATNPVSFRLEWFIGVQSANFIFDDMDIQLEIDWVRPVYEDGSPVRVLGTPGWEPKVYRGNGEWK